MFAKLNKHLNKSGIWHAWNKYYIKWVTGFENSKIIVIFLRIACKISSKPAKISVDNTTCELYSTWKMAHTHMHMHSISARMEDHTTDELDDNHSNDSHWEDDHVGPTDVTSLYWSYRIEFICTDVILPIVVLVGLSVNVAAFFVWMCGSKSKSMCCAIYFAANATVDFLFITHPLLWNDNWHFGIVHATDFTCKRFESTYSSIMHLSTCISAIITVERSLTIFFPFVFKSQTMRKRSKVIILVMIVLQPCVQFVPLLYIERWAYKTWIFRSAIAAKYSFIFYAFVCILLPFSVILTFNVATPATLIRRNTVTGRQNHIHVFTKLALFTGVSFVLSYTLMALQMICNFLHIDIDAYISENILDTLGHTMLYVNSVMNPIICFIVCKCVRDDVKQMLTAVARMIRRICTCKTFQQDTQAFLQWHWQILYVLNVTQNNRAITIFFIF